MSDYKSDADRAEEKLNKISGAMCLAKWYHTSLHLTTGLTSSCYHPPLHKIDPTDLKAKPWKLHNTDTKIEERQDMLQNIRPPGCEYCWNIEDQGSRSDRIYRSGEPWAMDHYDDVLEDKETARPTYMEVNFNNACNLKCSYCSPEYSSTWAAETKLHGAWPTEPMHNAPEHFQGANKVIPQNQPNPYREAFWEWWPEIYPTLRHFRMTGGEPTMDPNTYKVFDYVLENPKPDLHLNVTSNFSVDDRVFEKYLDYCKRLCEGEKIEHFMQFVSVDTFGDQAEYIRNGLDFNRLVDNVNRFLNEIPGRNSVTFICTMNNLAAPRFHKLLAMIKGLREIYSSTYQRVWFDVPMLTTPSWQSLQILPEPFAWFLEMNALDWMKSLQGEELNDFRDFEVQKLERVIKWMRRGQDLPDEYRHKQMANFARFFKEHDRRRNTDFEATFPELKEFWGECLYHVNNS